MGESKLRTIHVVDDDYDVRDSMRVLLDSLGFKVRTFASAAEYLSAPAGEVADCMLLDLQMPGMTGLELLETLRARNIQAPAIIVTSNDGKFDPRMARAGVLAVLRKPVAGAALLQAIDQACGPG